MSAKIPDDWDGISYECLQIQWPASEQWRAILLGQANEAYQDTYWEGSEAERQAASLAVQNAMDATFSEGLDCEMRDIPRGFSAVPDASQIIPASTWTPIVFADPEWFLNNPGFEYTIGGGGHRPSNNHPAAAGLWHYSAIIRINEAPPPRLHLAGGLDGIVNTEIGFTFLDDTRVIFTSFDYYWTGQTNILNLMFFSTTNSVTIDPTKSRWYAHQVARLEE